MSEKYSREWWAERLAFIEAFAHGDNVQLHGETMIDKHTFRGDPEDYRIKPAPVAPDEYWINVYNYDAVCHRSEEDARGRCEDKTALAVAVRYVRAEDQKPRQQRKR